MAASNNTKQKKRDLKEIQIPKVVLDDPRKALFLQLYLDRESPTFGNAKQSAIQAGYDEDYASQITYQRPKWFLEFLRQQQFVDLAEAHLREVLMMPNVTQAMGAFGPLEKTETIKEDTGEVYKTGKRKGQPKLKNKKIKVPILVRDVSMIKEKTAAAKIVLPAHDPEVYGKKDGPKLSFTYNVKEVRQRYQPSS